MQKEFYWELLQHDKTIILIPPGAVETVKRRWDNGQPIHTSAGSIPANQIKTFRKTSKPFGQQLLLETAAQAFKEALYTENGALQATWVKKEVTQREWIAHYSKIPAYKRLDDNGTMTTVAFLKPTHEIDVNKTPYCTDDEIGEVERD